LKQQLPKITNYQQQIFFGFLGKNIVSQRHQIPRGGLFELVSCPNYWAEILIYSSFAFIFSFQNPCWNAVLFWVISNQVSEFENESGILILISTLDFRWNNEPHLVQREVS